MDVTGIGLDLLIRRFGDEALLSLLEVALIVERQRRLDALAQLDRELRGLLALRVEMFGSCRHRFLGDFCGAAARGEAAPADGA